MVVFLYRRCRHFRPPSAKLFTPIPLSPSQLSNHINFPTYNLLCVTKWRGEDLDFSVCLFRPNDQLSEETPRWNCRACIWRRFREGPCLELSCHIYSEWTLFLNKCMQSSFNYLIINFDEDDYLFFMIFKFYWYCDISSPNCNWSHALFSWVEKKELSFILFKFIMLDDFNVLGIVHGMLWQLRNLLITLWVPRYISSVWLIRLRAHRPM